MSAPLFDPAIPYRATFDGMEYTHARVLRVIDGDTVEATLSLGFDVTLTVPLRIADLFCAELRSGTTKERQRGAAARDAGQRLLPDGRTIYVRVEKTASGTERATLGRLVAHVRCQDATGRWIDYAAEMRAQGFDGAGTGAR